MKKLAMLLLCGGLLVACSNTSYNVKVSDNDEALITCGDMKITKQDYFEYLLDRYGSTEVLQEALTAIADKELNDQDALNKLITEKKAEYAKAADGDFAKYVKSAGYESEDEYVEKILTPSCKQELLRKKYIDEHLDKLLKSYQVASFKKIVVDKESTALSIIKEATSEEAFDKLMKDNGTNAEDAGIVTKNSTLDDNLKSVLEKLSQIDKDGVYSEAIKLSDDTYAVIYLYNTDHKNTDELTTKLSSDSNVQKEIEGSYLKKYNFKVNDDKIKSAIKDISDQYIE